MTSSDVAFAKRASGRFVPAPTAGPARSFSPAGAVVGAAAPGPARTAPAPSREEELARAYADGLAAGRAELPWQDAESLRTAAGALEEAAHALAALRRSYLVAHRHALVDLAVAMAERLLARAVEADRDALASVVERSLVLVGGGEPIQVSLAPGDLAAVEAGQAPMLARLATEHGVALGSDPTLGPGDVRILAGASRVDARLHECLERLRGDLAELADAEEGAA